MTFVPTEEMRCLAERALAHGEEKARERFWIPAPAEEQLQEMPTLAMIREGVAAFSRTYATREEQVFAIYLAMRAAAKNEKDAGHD
jgi:hypothetical protein